MKTLLLTTVKIVYVCILFSAFLYAFGIPNLKKYLEDESVVVLKREYASEPIDAPSITMCPFNTNRSVLTGWKTGNRFSKICQEATKENLISCLTNNSYSLQESITKLKVGQENIAKTEGLFKSEIFFNEYGQCHTLTKQLPIPKYGKSQADRLRINMNATLQMEIILYDSKYFYPSKSLEAFPGIRVNIVAGHAEQVSVFILKIVKHIKRNTAESPCNDEADYSFSHCLRRKVEDKVGCSLPWVTDGKLMECMNRTGFDAYNRIYTNIFGDMNRKEIAEYFGCNFPCRYKEFVLVKEIKVLKKHAGIKQVRLALSTEEIIVKEEKPYYEINSLVGDIGGSLGLFLGFSFWMFMDWVLFVVNAINAIKGI